MGYIADLTNIGFGFIVPLLCFLVVFVYAISWKKMEIRDSKGV
jgi:fucose permease